MGIRTAEASCEEQKESNSDRNEKLAPLLGDEQAVADFRSGGITDQPNGLLLNPIEKRKSDTRSFTPHMTAAFEYPKDLSFA